MSRERQLLRSTRRFGRIEKRLRENGERAPRPPTARRFYLTELTMHLIFYISSRPSVLINSTNASPIICYYRHPQRRFVSSPSTVKLCPSGQLNLQLLLYS